MEVFLTERHGVHPHLARRLIDQSLGDRAFDRMTDRAVLAHHRLVLIDDVCLGPVVFEQIRPADHVHDLVGLDGTCPRIHRIGADPGQIVDLERGDRAVGLDGDLALNPVVAGVNVAGEAFQPIGDIFHRAFEHDRQADRRNFVGERVDLDAERSADVAGDDPDAVFFQPEMGRQNVLDHVRTLVVVPHRQLVFGRFIIGDQPARFQADAGMTPEDERILYDVIGIGIGRIDIAEIGVASPGKIVAKAFMDDLRIGIERFFGIDGDRQDFPVDLDQGSGILGFGTAIGDDGDDGLALPARGIERQRVLRR